MRRTERDGGAVKSKAIDGLRPVAVEDSLMFQPKHLTCKSCGGTGRNRTTGGACRVCNKGRLNATGAKGEPMELRKPGEPSGWNQNGEYRTEDRRVALHRALDRVMDGEKEDYEAYMTGSGPEHHTAELLKAVKEKRPFSIKHQFERQPSLFGRTYNAENLPKAVSKDRRATLHRALDRVMDARRGRAGYSAGGVTKSAWEDADQRQVEAWLRQVKAPKMLGPNRPTHAVPWDRLPKDVKDRLRALDT